MKQEYIDKIKSYYDKTGEFKLNDRYSGEQGAVYAKDGDKYHWLVPEQKGKSGLEARQREKEWCPLVLMKSILSISPAKMAGKVRLP